MCTHLASVNDRRLTSSESVSDAYRYQSPVKLWLQVLCNLQPLRTAIRRYRDASRQLLLDLGRRKVGAHARRELSEAAHEFLHGGQLVALRTGNSGSEIRRGGRQIAECIALVIPLPLFHVVCDGDASL